MKSGNLRFLLYGTGFVALQIMLMRHLEIYGATSDLVLLFLLWLATKKSKTACILFAASLGFLQDSLTDLWGVHMFSKTLTIFILHGYLNRIKEKQLIFWQVFLFILMSAILHNSIFFGVTLFSDLYSTGFLTLSILIYSPIYTSFIGSFLHLVKQD